jgi:hypothetical protein
MLLLCHDRISILTSGVGMAKRKPKPGHVQLDVHMAVSILFQHAMGLDPSLDTIRCIRHSYGSH